MSIAELFALYSNAKTRLFFQSISFLRISRNFKNLNVKTDEGFLEINKDDTIPPSFCVNICSSWYENIKFLKIYIMIAL